MKSNERTPFVTSAVELMISRSAGESICRIDTLLVLSADAGWQSGVVCWTFGKSFGGSQRRMLLDLTGPCPRLRILSGIGGSGFWQGSSREEHLPQAGCFSSHFTRLVLQLIQPFLDLFNFSRGFSTTSSPGLVIMV